MACIMFRNTDCRESMLISQFFASSHWLMLSSASLYRGDPDLLGSRLHLPSKLNVIPVHNTWLHCAST